MDFQTIKPGAQVKLVFDNDPGRIHQATIVTIPEGVGQGQVAVSGTLAKAGAVAGARAYPAIISIPKDIERDKLRLGMPGTATVFAEKAGRYWDVDVDPGLDQLLHRVFVNAEISMGRRF